MATDPTMDLSVSTFFPLPPSQVFSSLIEELALALGGARLTLEPGEGGRLMELPEKGEPVEVARILKWDPGEGILFQWHPPEWAKRGTTQVEVRLVPERGGTRVTVEHRGFGHGLLGEGGEELVGWFASEVAATLFRSTSPQRLGDWVTDRHARRPSGPRGRETYRAPLYHRANFAAILEGLALTSRDRLLEIGCGGGVFLQDALRCGCTAAAIDHSVDLLHVAAEQNEEAISQERLELVYAEADHIPFPDGKFTCAVMTGVLGFLPDAPATFREIYRTLAPGGRIAIYTGTRVLRGTPADPEPIASRFRYYEDRELRALASGAGFAEVRLEHPDLSKYAREAGVPREAWSVFKGPASQLLWARKPVGPTARAARSRAPAKRARPRKPSRPSRGRRGR